MKKKRYSRTLIPGALAALMLMLSVTTCISARRIYEISFRNRFNTGSVAIDLRQEQIDPDGVKRAASGQVILPGDHVSYMPEVENLRADAYVRVRIDIVMAEETSVPVTAADVFAVTDGWIQKGDCFYNTRIMKKGDVSIAFQGIAVPECWTADPEGGCDGESAAASAFRVMAHADAIQAANFHPDFTSDSPWGAVITEEAKSSDGNSYSVAMPAVTTNEMAFRGTSGFEAGTKDLFRNFQLYKAGNVYEDELKISNDSARPVTLYFAARSADSDINAKMKLRILRGSDEIYKGDLVSRSLDSFRELARIDAGDSISLKYIVTLPEDSGNMYSVLADETEWIFRAEEDDNPRTGEGRELLAWIALLAGSLVMITIITDCARRKHRNREREAL